MIALTDAPAPVSAEELAARGGEAGRGRAVDPAELQGVSRRARRRAIGAHTFTFERDNEPNAIACGASSGCRRCRLRARTWSKPRCRWRAGCPTACCRSPRTRLATSCASTADGGDGPVLFWDHEYEGDPADEANLYVVAPNFRTFLDGLDEPAERPPPTPKDPAAVRPRLTPAVGDLPFSLDPGRRLELRLRVADGSRFGRPRTRLRTIRGWHRC